MKTIDVEKIIALKGLNKSDVAQQLFPTNQFANLALNRVIDGKGLLDATQISKLALLAGCTIDALYGTVWNPTSNDGVHTFENGDYVAKLDTKTWVTKIFHKNSMIHESIISSHNVPLSQYIESLNKIVETNENV